MLSTFKIFINGNNDESISVLVEIFKEQGIPLSKDDKKYEASRNKDFNSLIEREVFTPAHEDENNAYSIYGSRFVHYVNYEGTPKAYEES